MIFLPTILLIASPSQGGFVEQLWVWTGPRPLQYAGASLTVAGDFSGDGKLDFLAGAPRADPNGPYSGSVFILNGQDGSLLRRFDGAEAWAQFGFAAAAAGDVNGDLIPDFLVGAPDANIGTLTSAGAAFLLSGLDGTLLARWNGATADGFFGGSLAAGADLTGDGIPDLVLGDSRHTQGTSVAAGRFVVLSGATRARVFEQTGAAYSYLAAFLAVAPDLDGDGVQDLLCSESGAPPVLHAYSVVRGSLIWSTNPTSYAGVQCILPVGDLDGDLQPDLLAGCPYSNPSPAVIALSGATGAELFRMESPPHDTFGSALCLAGDWDGDDWEDIAVGAPWAAGPTGPNEGLVEIRSLATTAQLGLVTTGEAVARFGGALAHAELLGSGERPFLVGAELGDHRGWVDTGSVQCFTHLPGLRADQSDIRASLQEDLQFELDFPSDYGQHHYQLLISAAGIGSFSFGVDVPLALDAWVLRTLTNQFPASVIAAGTRGLLDPQGNANASLTVPAGLLAGAVGRTLAAAAIVVPPFGATAELSSMAWRIRILP